jgi:hypothetical protein
MNIYCVEPIKDMHKHDVKELMKLSRVYFMIMEKKNAHCIL